MSPSILTMELVLNLFAILLSMIAVIYCLKLYRQLYKQDEREVRGWRWIFVAVLGILLFNISSVYLLANVHELSFTINISRLFPNARNPTFVLDVGMMEIFNVLGRTIIGFSITVGIYLLYAPMRRTKGAKYRFVPVTPAIETPSTLELKYDLEAASIYLVKEERPVEGSSDYLIKGALPNKSLTIFVDLVTHGFPGLCITRTHPQKVRDKYKLKKVPILWLSRSMDYKGAMEPSHLVELQQTIKEFIVGSENSVVLLDGLEYLITQNNFDVILQFVQSLNDTVSLSSSRLVIPLDPSTLDDRQLHLLEREMNEITSVWRG